MITPTDIADLLHAGLSDRAIARQLNVHASKVAPIRAALGIPKATSARPTAATPEDAFWQRVKPTDDDHMEWTGPQNNSGVPVVYHHGHGYSAYRISYRIANEREPEGYAQPSCGRDRCVKPGHHADRTDREREKRVDALYAGIFPGHQP